MGLWQEVNQVYLLHRLALQRQRERASLYPGPALQGLDKLLYSEASTPLRCLALFTLPKQAEDSLRPSRFEKRLRTLLLGMRQKSDWGQSKQRDPDRGQRFRVHTLWVPFQTLPNLPTTMLLNLLSCNFFHLQSTIIGVFAWWGY